MINLILKVRKGETANTTIFMYNSNYSGWW